MDLYYEDTLNKFRSLPVTLVKHDNSPTGLPCYIEVKLGYNPKAKDRGGLVVDLGNYIYRTLGLRYQMTPEFRGKGKTTTLRWFMTWDDVAPILPNIYKAVSPDKRVFPNLLPFGFYTLIIQDQSRGVTPQVKEIA